MVSGSADEDMAPCFDVNKDTAVQRVPLHILDYHRCPNIRALVSLLAPAPIIDVAEQDTPELLRNGSRFNSRTLQITR